MKTKTIKFLAAGITAMVSFQAGYALYHLSKLKKIKDQFKTIVMETDKTIDFTGKEFSGDAILVACGSMNLDLSKAIPTSESISIILKASYCGVKIIVPRGWNVRGEGKTFFGGFTNKTNKYESPEQPLLIIHYDINFAGVDVCNPVISKPEKSRQ